MRLFVAVWPPAEVLDAIEGLERPAQAGVRWTTRGQWHVTLRFLGQIDDVGLVEARLGDVTGAVTGLVASAGPVTRRLGSSLVILPVAGLDRLGSHVIGATATLGESPPDRPFLGHLTLARIRRGDGAVVRGGARRGGGCGDGVRRGLVGAALSATWPVTEVTLVASNLHHEGARYEIIARFPLG